MGKFVITTKKNGDYQFKLKGNNGQVVLVSQDYSSKINCENDIESVRLNSQNNGQIERKKSLNGKYYFNLLSNNGQIIGTSHLYDSDLSRNVGIEFVKINAPAAIIIDESV